MFDNVLSALNRCTEQRDLQAGIRLHESILANTSKLGQDTYVCNLLIQMYGKCRSIENTVAVFHTIARPNIFSWNLILQAHIENNHLERARTIFESMHARDLVSFIAMVTAYAEDGDLDQAKRFFDEMPEHNSISCTAMMNAFVNRSKLEEAKFLFDEMPYRNVFTWTALLSAYAQYGHLEQAKALFDMMPEHNLVPCTSLIQAFSETGDVLGARKVFDAMEERNIISWTTMLTAYAQEGDLSGATLLLCEMPERNDFTWSAMVKGYSLSGEEISKSFFERSPEWTVVSWTGLIEVYAQKGHIKAVKSILQQMEMEGQEPDSVLFLTILTACSHFGLLLECWKCFVSMVRDHYLTPHNMHFCCLIDVLGRLGRLDDAQCLVTNLPVSLSSVEVAWEILLAACKLHCDFNRGAQAAKCAFGVDPRTPVAYVLLANIFSD